MQQQVVEFLAIYCFPLVTDLDLSPQVRSFYLFHVYFTVSRILYEIGGIESVTALPDDPTFKQRDNKYEIASYKKICGEFGIDPSSDFRFTHGKKNTGLALSTFRSHIVNPGLVRR